MVNDQASKRKLMEQLESLYDAEAPDEHADSPDDARCSECGAYGGQHIYRDCPNRAPA